MITQKVGLADFIETWCYDWNFWWASSGPRYKFRISHFSIFLTIAEYGILGDLLAFLIQSPPAFTKLGE